MRPSGTVFMTGVVTGMFVTALAFVVTPFRALGEQFRDSAKLVFTGQLPNVPGKSLTAVVVTYPPGGKSASHRHAGTVFAYVLSGKIRSENSATGPAKVYAAGESFFEPPGSEHRVSENASPKEPSSLLAVFVADDGAKLTTFSK